VTAEIIRHRTRLQFEAAVAVGVIENAMTRERLRLRGDQFSADEADAIEKLMEIARQTLGDF
jgi:hypothetical protein